MTTGDWHDRLVELHVLAEHGDGAAAAAAARWLDGDPAARAAWEAVTRTCDEVRRAADAG
jgi:hypothetical protein